MVKRSSGIEIVKRIDNLLSERFETRSKLCEAVGIKKDVISHWYARDTTPKADDLLNIAEYLNTSIEYLAFGEEKKESEISDRIKRKLDILSDEEKLTVELLIDGLINKKAMSRSGSTSQKV